MEQTQTKKCGRCKEFRSAGEFYRNGSRKDGLDPYCKVCKLSYKLSHQEQERASQQKTYHANLEANRARARRRMSVRRALMTIGKEDDPTFAAAWETLCAHNAYRCFCCGRERPLHIDHVVPVTHGGSHDLTNLQPLCASCSKRKSDTALDYREQPNRGN